ncbi:MACROPHAGE ERYTHROBLAST ATTACHER-RELATED [Salix koriyanagi]|uniref:MACROPHAGE ERYTHROBLAST ATTACHER-RELATED n=1 Tax=Salix koriyanagi TaxID=2511006 RepID=A0A9Q0TRE9_9ROSI|nr:MACROPHAGE ERYTHROBLAST ATTACHER-RELATED [Salix koriyanagi]
MELTAAKDAFDRVAKKQKLSFSKCREVIDQVSQEIEQALVKIQSVEDPMSPANQKSILTELKHKLIAINPLKLLEGSQKELNLNLSKFPKLLEKSFPDISKAYRDVDFDFHIVNQIIASHFYHQGLFDLGDCLINEAGEPEAAAQRSHFLELHQILEAMRIKNIEPALKWVSTNREKLVQNGSNLELKLHQLQFVEILKRGNRADALSYAKTHLAFFCFKSLERVSKANSLHNMDRQNLKSLQSPLSVAIVAGIEGLPTLLKLANVMAAKKQEWQALKQLPVPVELGKEFQFHSIFVCPVSRDQGSEENPPMLLPCLHVLCKQSIMKLSKGSSRAFKCPYCPAEASAVQCRQLYF